jgi:hypothetical protein
MEGMRALAGGSGRWLKRGEFWVEKKSSRKGAEGAEFAYARIIGSEVTEDLAPRRERRCIERKISSERQKVVWVVYNRREWSRALPVAAINQAECRL